jgi:hypothetical protein
MRKKFQDEDRSLFSIGLKSGNIVKMFDIDREVALKVVESYQTTDPGSSFKVFKDETTFHLIIRDEVEYMLFQP